MILYWLFSAILGYLGASAIGFFMVYLKPGIIDATRTKKNLIAEAPR